MSTNAHPNLRTHMLPGHIPAVNPADVVELMKDANPPLVLDVRGASEVERSRPTLPEVVANMVHMPMQEVPSRMNELPKDRLILVLCLGGGRSGAITRLLTSNGYEAVNIDGGMLKWILTVEPTLPRP